jgi:hypothetical protein
LPFSSTGIPACATVTPRHHRKFLAHNATSFFSPSPFLQ